MTIFSKIFNNIDDRCKKCNFAKEAFFEFFKKSHEQNEQYTRIVVSIGYVSYITLLSKLGDVLYRDNIKICYLCSIIAISVSLSLFVGYEIWKVKSTNEYEKELIDKFFKVTDDNQKFSLSDFKNEIKNAQITAYSNIIKATNWIFISSVLCAIISAFCFLVCVGILFR